MIVEAIVSLGVAVLVIAPRDQQFEVEAENSAASPAGARYADN